jgi:hypothetical protein
LVDTRLTLSNSATNLSKMIGTNLGHAESFQLVAGLLNPLSIPYFNQADAQRNRPAQSLNDVSLSLGIVAPTLGDHLMLGNVIAVVARGQPHPRWVNTSHSSDDTCTRLLNTSTSNP